MRSISYMRTAMILIATLAATAVSAAEITLDNVVAQMNVRRAAAGLPPLAADERLCHAAEDRMRDMEDQGYWAHISPDGRSPFEWLRPRGYIFAYAGENLAAGFETAEVLVDGWMESEGHRDNIMSPIYKDCGIAIIEGATTGRATGRSIVVLFGRPMNPDPPLKAAR
ncbi:MAG: hypothetical protein JJE51_14665 [Thermoanaerobaculia bacterium]|nr:hypothetical protein [Thermoanaerobaculia bacterium]